MRVLSFIQSSFWAMRDAEFDRLLHVATRNADALERIAANAQEKNFSSLLAKPGQPLSATRYVDMRGSVAVIDLNGTISKRMNLFAELCDGGTSTEILMQDFKTALDDPTVTGIVFNIDSPGGEAFGINEFAQSIYKARGKKPIKAYVSGLGCSGAYWIASACDSITLDSSAFVGSIGVVSVWMDDRNFYKSLGIDKKVITSSNAPKKRLDLNNESDMAEFQTELDSIESVFIDAVIRNRNTNKTNFKNNFNQGGVLCGQMAVDAGMADRVGSLEQVIAELAKNPAKSNNQNASKAALKGEMNMSFMDKVKEFIGMADELKPLLEAESNKDTPKANGDNSQITGIVPGNATATFNADRERIAVLEQQNKLLLEEKKQQQVAALNSKAANFALAEIKAGRLTSAEDKDFQATYLQALSDDATNPLSDGTSRAGNIEAAQQKRPPHLFAIHTLPATAKILSAEDADAHSETKAAVSEQVTTYISVTSPKSQTKEKN